MHHSNLINSQNSNSPNTSLPPPPPPPPKQPQAQTETPHDSYKIKQEKKLELLKKQQELLSNQISLSKKLLSKLNTNAEKIALLQKIKNLQSKYNDLQKETCNIVSKNATTTTPVYNDYKKVYSLDKRSKTLLITFDFSNTTSDELISKQELQEQLSKYGAIIFVREYKNKKNNNVESLSFSQQQYLAKFTQRHFAESAKNDVDGINDLYKDVDVSIAWFQYDPSNQNGKETLEAKDDSVKEETVEKEGTSATFADSMKPVVEEEHDTKPLHDHNSSFHEDDDDDDDGEERWR